MHGHISKERGGKGVLTALARAAVLLSISNQRVEDALSWDSKNFLEGSSF